ncbi:MAG: hypothetical protein R3B06_04060 [Kofleriaceae bacterium]
MREGAASQRRWSRVVVGATLLAVVALALLWREVRAPAAPIDAVRHGGFPGREPRAAGSTPAAPRPIDGAGEPAATGQLPPPPGGVRAWSTTAAPGDGPDPFAPVPQVRTEADTRAGLDP